MGSVVEATPREHADRIFANVPAEVHLDEGPAGGASWLRHEVGQIFRVLGMEARPARRVISQFWPLVRQEVKGIAVAQECPSPR